MCNMPSLRQLQLMKQAEACAKTALQRQILEQKNKEAAKAHLLQIQLLLDRRIPRS